jgi:hypothetical protein
MRHSRFLSPVSLRFFGFLAAGLFSMPGFAPPPPQFSVDGLRYEITSDNEVAVAGFLPGAETPELDIPASVTESGNTYQVTSVLENAFYYCALDAGGSEVCDGYVELTKVLLPNTLKKIGLQAFYSQSIKEIVIPPSVTVIEDCGLCDNYFSTLTIPQGVEVIEDNAFSYQYVGENSEIRSLLNVHFDGDFKAGYSLNMFRDSPNLATITYCSNADGWPVSFNIADNFVLPDVFVEASATECINSNAVVKKIPTVPRSLMLVLMILLGLFGVKRARH